MSPTTPGQIIILTGPPRSGKSSIAREIQAEWPGVWMNLGVDGFMAMTPPRILPGIGLRPGGERPDIEEFLPSLYRAAYESIAAHSRIGINVVADFGHHDGHSKPLNIRRLCRDSLQGLPQLWVGIRCPLSVLMERRRASGWPTPEDLTEIPDPVLRWQTATEADSDEDLALDTSLMSPGKAAQLIWDYLERGEGGLGGS